jgi:hypothetical protein
MEQSRPQGLDSVLQKGRWHGNAKNKEGLLLCYRETCGHVVTYQDAAVTGVTPYLVNPNSTENNFDAAALGEEPPTLALALDPALVATHVHGTMVDIENEDWIVASTAILALDPAARTGRPKDDTEGNTALSPALTRATTAPAWDKDDTPPGPADSALNRRPRPMYETLDDIYLPLFQVESESESSDEESVFDVMGL